MKKEMLKKIGAAVMAAVLAVAPAVTSLAASSTDATNNTATKNDLANADIIDMSKTGSLTIYKYDITAAEAAGDYKAGTYKATGENDSRVEEALAGYGIEGVQFSYLRVGNLETHSKTGGTDTFIEVVYEIPTALADILNLTADEAVDMDGDGEAFPCSNTGVYHYTSQQLSDALAAILEADDVLAKDALETYFYDYGSMDSTKDQKTIGSVTNMPKTDANGYTHVEGLNLGLYMVVETEVPEQVVETTNPWFVSLPFTNTSAQEMTEDGTYASSGTHDADGVTNSQDADGTDANTSGGEQWLYDMVCYPKNQTGNPTLDKSVRNAYSNTLATDKNGTVNAGSDYVSDNTSDALVIYNKDTNAENTADADDAAYVANRGGYTKDGVTAGKDGAGYSVDFEYRDTTTASEGDVLDYILVSKLPHISSKATFLSEYTFTDILSEGLTYNQDVKIAFYHTAADANANHTANADLIWDLSDGTYAQGYVDVIVTDPMSGKDQTDGSTRLTVKLTEAGLAVVNGTKGNSNTEEAIKDLDGLSDYYMVVYYTATVNSDASVVLGDDGNENNVVLTWSRTSDGYYNVLEDRNYVYSYSLDLTKTFSDNKGNLANVQFKLYNSTDAYYVVAREDDYGVYYVTGKTTDEAKGTTFVPNPKDGSLLVNGLEADKYQLTEVATDDGYALLKDQIVINIEETDREVIASVAGVTGMTEDDIEKIVEFYHGGIYNENGELVTSSKDALTGEDAARPAIELANGRTIGKTDMFVGAIQPASATVDGVDVSMAACVYTKGNMADEYESANAMVVMKVQNSKKFTLPLTGGNGLYAVTIIGVAVAAAGCFILLRKKKKSATKDLI